MSDLALEFERTLQLLLGDRAYQSAGEEANTRARRKRLREMCKLLACRVMDLDTTVNHRERILAEIQCLEERLKTAANVDGQLVYPLFRLVARLLGHEQSRGARPYTPAYFQTESQRFTSDVLDHNEGAEHFDSLKANAMTLRRAVALSLRAKGIDTFTIGLALNCSEHHVKKLLRGL